MLSPEAMREAPDGYEVRADGTVWNLASGRKLIPRPNRNGYLRVRFQIGPERRSAFVHKLVAAAFVGPPPSEVHELRHLDGNKRNNAATNLAWGTRKQNADDRTAHGRTVRGSASPSARLNEEQVAFIRQRVASGVAKAELARLFGVSDTTIGRACDGNHWRHVNEGIPSKWSPKHARHGTSAKYEHDKCRCDLCRAAEREKRQGSKRCAS